jgi:tRNA uridine 5-carboxymethylaminomethyl modification enzyme
MLIPESFDYAREALNLSTEARQKLAAVKPRTLGQASRISGVSPADLSAMMILLHKRSQTVDSVV